MTTRSRLGDFWEQAGLFFSAMFYVLFAWHQWWSGVAPRLIRGSAEREAIHHAHLSIGATLFVFLIIGGLIWLLRPGGGLLQRLRGAFANVASTAVSLFFVFMLLTMLCGFGQAWAKDEHVLFLGVFPLPVFLDWSWGTSGYMHSALSNIASALFSGMVFVFLYIKLSQYVKPGLAVALLMVLHLLVNLPKPPSLHPIAAFGTYVMTPTFYLVGLALYCWAKERRFIYWPVFALFILFFMYLPYFAFKVLPPWHATPAAETVLVESKDVLRPIRAKEDIFRDQASLESAKQVANWCAQCHNLTPSDSHLLGPNLVGVFNRQAGTAEGYGRYSSVVQSAGTDGMYWTPENLGQFLTAGQTFLPGNLMNQQTDLSDPEKLGQVIDYLEYLSAP